jgi:hypothetical protein
MLMHSGSISRLAGFVCLVTALGFGQTATDPWLILASGDKGAINAHTTRQEFVRMYGASNVVDQDVDVGEGETEPGTIIFPKDAQRSIEILWKDPDKKTEPRSATISGKKSRWHTIRGISLGTSLRELESLNGRPFKLAGFGWDYSGTVTSWESGALAAELDGGHGRVFLRLDSGTSEAVDKEVAQVEGDRDFSSNHPVMQKLNPRAYQIIWVFPSPAK